MELAIPLISPAKKRPKTSGNICNNKFKVTTTSDTATLEYYQSIYTHCKQRFNIPDGIEVVKKSVYQYIENHINNYLFGNYNISKVRSNLYNNLAHYSQLGTEDLNSKTLAIYFHKLNFNIIKYCKETYLVHNKGKNKLKQYSQTTPNTLILPKTTAIHLQTPEQGTSSKFPLTITSFPALLAQAQTPNLPLNQFTRPEDFTSLRTEDQSENSETAANEENEPEISEEESIDSENEEDEMITYITKIPKFNGEDIKTSPQEWLNQVTKARDANGWNATRMLRTIPYFLKRTAGEWFENLAISFNDWNAFKAAFLEQFTDNNTSITLRNRFQNIKQEPSEFVMIYIGKFNKLLRQIRQLKTNDYYSNAQILDQFITDLKDKLIKKIHPHAPEDLNSAIQHAKRYEMAMEEANHTKLVNLAIGETSSAAEEKIDQLTKKVENYFTNQQQQQSQRYQPLQRRNQNNFALLSNNQPQNCHYYQQNRSNQCYSPPQQSYYQPSPPAYYPPRPQYQNNYYHNTNNHPHNIIKCLRISSNNQLVLQNSTQPRPNHYYTQPTNESSFLLSNVAVNEQKAITVMYTEAEVERKPICLILDSGSTGSIVTHQLMQQLKKNIDRPAQTIIVTADSIKKTPVGEIDNFPFTLNGITIPTEILVMDAPQYQALVRNDWLQKANAKLDWETQELQISYQGQHAQVPTTCGIFNKHSEKALAFEFEPEEEKPIIETFMALGSMSNWADETEQEHFTPHSKPETSGWNIPYSKSEPRKQCPYIPLKYKDCHKKLLSIGACISTEEEYENHTCYYCKACHREQWSHLIKRSGKWDNTPCLTCGDMLPEKCNWIDVTMRGGVCDQTCQYALSISKKVKRGTPFNAAYNSALNKLYHYLHDAKMIFDLAIALINGATKKNVRQMKEAEYIEYIMELAGFDYEDECPECYALNISLPSENDENEIEFEELEETEEIEITPIYLIKNQPALQLKYFNNNGQGIKSKKTHEIDAGYDLRYPDKDTLVLKLKSLTKINLKIALEIPPEAMVQIASRSSLASKGINVRGGIINAGYTGDITIEHAKKIAQAIYLPLINILGLQLVNQKEQLGKSDRGTQGFGSTGRFTVPVNIALNTQNEFHQILRLSQPITISPFGEHPEIYTCPKPTTTQQIFESNKQVCLEHNILIPNIYIPEGTKKVRVTFYNPNNYSIILLNNLKIGVIHSNIFQKELPQTVPDFSEIIRHSLPKINPNPSFENYHIVMEKLSRINMGQLEPQQQTQLKELIAEFADIFAENNNDLGRTDLVQHQIYIGDAKPRRQQAY
ncbi:hypothetical protein G9A89_004892 [Geosiphon pyriformis]|nr:hypothetical protein G9A89_004892 [Geosiphon pyriformis]